MLFENPWVFVLTQPFNAVNGKMTITFLFLPSFKYTMCIDWSTIFCYFWPYSWKCKFIIVIMIFACSLINVSVKRQNLWSWVVIACDLCDHFSMRRHIKSNLRVIMKMCSHCTEKSQIKMMLQKFRAIMVWFYFFPSVES